MNTSQGGGFYAHSYLGILLVKMVSLRKRAYLLPVFVCVQVTQAAHEQYLTLNILYRLHASCTIDALLMHAQ